LSYSIYGSLQQVKEGAKGLAQIVLGASHLAQVAIPSLLLVKPHSLHQGDDRNDDTRSDDELTTSSMTSYNELMEWKCSIRNTLYEQAMVLCMALQQIGPCLHVIEPRGAMYAMVQINVQFFNPKTIQNDIDFMTLLYEEENVIVLPGTCFHFPNSFRVVFCAPIPTLQEAADRIKQFCYRHLL
jgi:tyrosine aminotransferase